MLTFAKIRARTKGIEFSITDEDIVIPDTCPYLGCKLTTIQGQGIIDSNVSLDRIDNNKGYIPGNVRVISNLANRMKLYATEEQLLAFAKGVLAVHGNSPT